jgi:NDP-sugar pyrophosphorylase family protein
MDRDRLTITLRNDLLKRLDNIIDGVQIRNRSHAIEFLLTKSLSPKVSQAIILAGGKGVKMRPLTYEIPKPLILVGGKPVISYAIEMLRDAGISEIIIAIGHLGNKIKEEIGNGKKFGITISYSEEITPLGNAGALKNASSFLQKKTFVVMNGDVLTALNLSDLIAFHEEEKYVVTMALSTEPNTKGYGVARLRGEKIVGFIKQDKKQITQHINAGVYIMNHAIFKYITDNGKETLDDIFIKLAKEEKLAGYSFDGAWYEVSTPENYTRAIKEWNKSTPSGESLK